MASDAPTDARRRNRNAGDPPGLFRDSRTGVYGVRKTFSPGPGRPRVELTRSLRTKDKAKALRAYAATLAQLQFQAEERRDRPLTPVAEVERWRVLLATGTVDAEASYEHKIEQLLGPQIGEAVDRTGQAVPVYGPGREAAAVEFADTVSGRRVPVDFFLVEFLRGKSLRYQSRIRLAVAQLATFLRERPGGNALRTLNRRLASDFVRHLSDTERSTTTARAKVSALSSYWEWLWTRGDVSENVWAGHRMPKRSGRTEVRPFTDDEMRALLCGTEAQPMADFIRVAALTGMRREEIGQLLVADCAAGNFRVRKGKTAAAARTLPIHSCLKAIVERRTSGKAGDAYLFDDLPKSEGTGRGRTEKMGERFTKYRREVGVDDRRDDGRSRVDFHSFRRWFVTEAVRHSGQPEWAVSELVGHAVPNLGQTIGTYYGGSLEAQKKLIVEAVKLPSGKPEGGRD